MTLTKRPDAAWFRQLPGSIDWFLLLFLLGFCIDSVVIKPVVLGLVLILMWRSLPRLGYRDAPWFYLALPAIEIVRYLFFSHDFSPGHTITVVIGCAYWIMAWLAFLVIRHRVRLHTPGQTVATMELWFLLNLLYSLTQLVRVMIVTGSLNPYGVEDPLYGNSTGDYIKGLFLAPCYLNMFVNSFFAVWFLYRRKWALALLAVLVCCLTTTNFANIIFLPVLLVLLVVFRERAARLAVAASLVLFIAFYGLVANGNITYLRQSVGNVFSGQTQVLPDTAPDMASANTEDPKQAAEADSAPLATADSAAAQSAGASQLQASEEPLVEDSATLEAQRIERIYSRLADHHGGKPLSWGQTFDYFKSSFPHALFGAGIGNFSSLLALHMSHIHGRKHSRFYERMPVYIHPDYRDRHYQIMSDVYALPDGYHSARHMPHSFPNQLIGEYGLLGLICFVFGYIAYFLRRGAFRGHFLVIMILTAGYLWFDYLFEYLSVMVFFELFFLQYRLPVTNEARPDA